MPDFQWNGSSSVLNQAKAIKYAADNGAVILQCSWSASSGRINPLMGTPGFTSDEEWSSSVVLQKEALEYFIHNAGDPNGVIDGGIAVLQQVMNTLLWSAIRVLMVTSFV